LLRDRELSRVDEVWSSDGIYVSIRHVFKFLTAVIAWYSRYVFSWRLSKTQEGRLRELSRVDEVWSSDGIYVSIRHIFKFLTAVIAWYSRYVFSWRLSKTQEGRLYLESLDASRTFSPWSLRLMDRADSLPLNVGE